MANFAKTFVFATTAEGWAYTVGADETGTYLSGSGNPAGSLEIDLTGKRSLGTGYWEWTGTFEDLGVPVDATINGYSSSALDYSAIAAISIDVFSSGPYTVNDGTLRTLVAAQTITGTTAFATLNQSGTITGLSLASTTSIALRITADMDTGNDNASNLNLLLDNVKITVDYTAAAVPILTLPTEADITGTTATVGCTTDTADGTLYWFVSETATPPTAVNLKAGTGAYSSQFGSQLSPGIGTETFSVTSLTQSDDYYTYFIHTNATGDSNILESGIWYAQSVITADDLQSLTQLTTPDVGQKHVLTADDLESDTQLTTPDVAQEHIITADDLESDTELSTPTVAVISPILADDLESDTELSTPTAAAISHVLADDLESATELSTPAIAQVHIITADDLESDTQLSTPTVAAISLLLADDLESATELSTPTAGQSHIVLADDLETATQLSTPTLIENSIVLVPDADNSVGSWTTEVGGSTNLYQQIDESPANDSDYVRSELGPSTSKYKASLSDPSESPDPAGNHIIRYRYRKDDASGQQINLVVRLVQGASTVIATWSHPDIGATIVQATKPLSSPEIASITDYTDLFLEFEANAP